MGLPKPHTIYRLWAEASAANPELTREEHADQMGIQLSVYLSRWHTGKWEHEQRLMQPGVPGEPVQVEGDALIVGDVHAPYTDYGMVALANQVARKYLKRPRRLIIGGDLFNQDMWSAWAAIVKPASWAEERDAVAGLLQEWLKLFDEIICIMGNHDRRLQKVVAGEFDEQDILALVSSSNKIKLSNYGHMLIRSGGMVYRVTHPRQYSVNQLTVLDQLAQKHQQNIIGFHEHHLSKGWDRYGRYVIVNGGILVDPGRLAYTVLDDSKSAVMKQGFVLLKNGVATPYGREPFTNWREVL